jgi:hypothetical protein
LYNNCFNQIAPLLPFAKVQSYDSNIND